MWSGTWRFLANVIRLGSQFNQFLIIGHSHLNLAKVNAGVVMQHVYSCLSKIYSENFMQIFS